MTITMLSVILFIAPLEGGQVTEVARFETMEQCMEAATGKQEPKGFTYFKLACVPT